MDQRGQPGRLQGYAAFPMAPLQLPWERLRTLAENESAPDAHWLRLIRIGSTLLMVDSDDIRLSDPL